LSRASASTRRAAISGDVVKVSGETLVVASGAFFASGIGVVTGPSGGGQVSGAVIVSGFVSVYSGQIAVSSGNIGAQVSGAVIVSGNVSAQVSGAVTVSGFVSIYSGQVAISSGEIHVVSGQVIAKVSGEIVDLKVPTSVTSGGIFTVTGASGGAILTSGPCISVTIKSISRNSGDIYVAGNSMQSGQGFVLEAGEAVNLDVDNMGRVNLLAQISGDRVTFVGVQ